jgi:glutamine synthetase
MATTTEDALARARAVIEEHGIHTVECGFADTWGHLRGKRIPASHFLRVVAQKGYSMADAAFIWDTRCDIFDLPFANPETGYGDMLVKPDLATLRPITWRDGTALVICDCLTEPSHEPVGMDPRMILRRQIDRLAELGYEPVVATELEFYLCNPDWTPAYDGIQCYSLTKGSELEPVMSDIRRKLEEYGIVVEASNTEYGPAQIEVNLGHGPAMRVADDTLVFKNVVKELARQHGLRATFMGKPFPGASGNGMHLHTSLAQGGANVFDQRTDDGDLQNETMRRWAAGLLAHAPAMTLIGCPTVNAYKRVEAYSFAPMNVSWGLDNRGVCVRCLPGCGSSTRIEYRGGAADANPYLLMAAMFAAGSDGLERTIDLPPLVKGDAYADETSPPLPRTLALAIEAFAESAFLRERLGEVFHTNYLAMARHESALYDAAITDWEFERYREHA